MLESKDKYFGRKKGKSFARLEQFQRFLFPPTKEFFKKIKIPRVLEIGIGDGVKISTDAKLHPDINYIGCDIFADGVLRAIRNSKENSLRNLFVFHLNIQEILPLVPIKYFDGIRIFFPDPWPKTKHKKRRTFNEDLLKQLLRVMKPGSCLNFASDHGDYFLDAMILVSKFGFKIKGNTPNMWQYSIFNAISTKYEKKALDKNSKLFYFSVLKSN